MVPRFYLWVVLESLKIAAGRKHHSLQFRLHLDPMRGMAKVAEVTFAPSSLAADPLSDFIEKRCADRRLYQGGSLDHAVFKTILKDSESSSTSRVLFSLSARALRGFLKSPFLGSKQTETIVYSQV